MKSDAMSALLALYNSSISNLTKLVSTRTPDTEEALQRQVKWLGELSRTLLSVYQIESAKRKSAGNEADPINSPPQIVPSSGPAPQSGLFGRPQKPGEWRP